MCSLVLSINSTSTLVLGVSAACPHRLVILLSIGSTAAYAVPWTHSIDLLWGTY